MPLIPSELENQVSIEPQYDGVVMLSSDIVFFNDAQTRPDGRKIYHIFEHCFEENAVEDEFSDKVKKELDSKKNELFSKASEQSIQNIQQVLAKNGISVQEWWPGASSSVASQVLQPNSSICNQDTHVGETGASGSQYSLLHPSTLDYHELFNTIMQQRIYNPSFIEEECEGLIDFQNLKLYKVYQFYLNLPADLQSSSNKSKLLKRLQRRGVLDVHFEPENFRITLKTLRSAQFILKILRKIDQNVFLLSTSYDLVVNEAEEEKDSAVSKHLKDL